MSFGIVLAGARLRHGICPAHEEDCGRRDGRWYCERCRAWYRLEVTEAEVLIHYENDRGERARARVKRG